MNFVICYDCTWIEIGIRVCHDFVMDAFQTTVCDRIIAIKEDDVFALRHIDPGVAGCGARSRAWTGEYLEPRISSSLFADNLLGSVFRCFDAEDTFPVLKRLVQDGLKTFLNVRFDITAGDDK